MTSTPELQAVFGCIGNSARSQMAHGFAKALGGNRVAVDSGGSTPLGHVLPEAIEVMREKGIDIREHPSKPFDIDFVRAADLSVTMGCGEDACPAFVGKRMEDWALPDPKGKDLAFFREVRDEIERRVRDLLERHDALESAQG